MNLLLKFLLAMGLSALALLAQAQDGKAIGVKQIETRPGVRVPVFEVWQPKAVANVVLFSGGGGGYGQIGEDGWPLSRNFLIRTGKDWAAHAFNLVMVGRPSDEIDLQDGINRIRDEHQADNLAIFKTIRQKNNLPIWVVGTSMGTISAAAAAIRDQEHMLAGVVLTSSITSYRVNGAVPKQDLDKIIVPVLVLHHAKDACAFCKPQEAPQIISRLSKAKRKELVLFEAGEGASGNPCEALHFHGYIGAEKQAVDLIAAWIQNNMQP